MKPKIKIMAAADNFHFIDPLIPALSEWFNIEKLLSQTAEYDELRDSDLIWLEWADGLCLNVLRESWLKSWSNKIILRLHRYELFTPRTIKQLENIYRKRIDKLVFVSKVVQQIGINKFQWMEESIVIPNLFDHTKFPLLVRDSGYNILMLGRISYVKNLPLALFAFYELLKIDSRFKLHIVGEISDPELVYYCANFIEKTGIDSDIIFHGRLDHDHLLPLMGQMNFVLSTSIFESQGMGIIEGMSCGLKPLVFNFPGAELSFSSECLWLDFAELKKIVFDYSNPSNYSTYAYYKFSIEKNIHLYVDLINEVLKNGTQQNGKDKM